MFKSGFGKKKEIIKRYTEQFIQNHIRYETMISSEGIMRQIALKSRHTIIISNVKHPKEIQIQLADNEPLLNNLMDEMEKVSFTI